MVTADRDGVPVRQLPLTEREDVGDDAKGRPRCIDVRAAGDGEVAFVGVVAGTPVVSIAHPNGLRTTYQPVDARVALGEQVSEGQTIGTLARTTSQFAREHSGLHWGALTGPDAYIDPLTLLDAPRIRLKPLTNEPHR